MPALQPLDLAPTRSYPARGGYWMPAENGTVRDPNHPDDGAHALAALGVLAIVTCTGPVDSRRVACTPYAVEAVETGTPEQVAYMLCKLSKPGEAAEVYQVEGGAHGRKCTCPAGSARRSCKHLDATAEAIRRGFLPGPKAIKPR